MIICLQPNDNYVKYCRYLGWNELDDEKEVVAVAILVVDSNIGYSVFRDGSYLHLLSWFQELEDAIDCAVERVQYEHAKHEINQEKG